MSTLEIRDLHVEVATENGSVEILKGVDLTVNSTEIALSGATSAAEQTRWRLMSSAPRSAPRYCRR